MKNLNKFLITWLLVLGSVSCNIGLGEAVDLTPPEVTITKPEIASSVNRKIELVGTAKDNLAVTSIKVTVEEAGLEYECKSGKWYKKSGDSLVEQPDSVCLVDGNFIEFTLYIDVDNIKSGDDLTIRTQAYDEYGNEGNKSKDERLVTMDISSPTVTVSEPALEPDYNKALAVHESYTLCDNTVLSSLLNQDVNFSGFQKEDTKLDKLVVYLDGSSSNQIPEKEEELTGFIYKKEFTGQGIRNWSFTVGQNEFPAEYRTGKHLIRVFGYSYDTAGNCERKVQGWFTYWNEADKPWVSATFGEDTVNTTKKVYPNCTLLGQAYDDDGLKEVSITTIKIDKNTHTESLVSELTTTKSLDSEGNPKYYAWSTNAISDIGQFYVVVKCKDIYGNESSSITRYLDVDDVTPPTIVVTTGEKLPLTQSSFTIGGYVEDDGGVVKLMMIRKTSAVTESMEVEYLNGYEDQSNQNNPTNDNVWYKALDADGKDKFGNKRWELDNNTLGVKVINNGVKRSFAFNLDWESDFDIKTDFSSNKLKTQTFILCAVDDNGMSRTQLITLGGDSTKPELVVEKVVVYSEYTSEEINTEKETKIFGNTTPELQPFNRDNNNVITDKIQLRGTWSDDSNYTTDITLNWVDSGPLTVTKKADGTWYTTPITPPEKSTAVIQASIEDLGENKTEVSKSFYVNGAIAQFLRISSEKADGYYNSGDIKIYLEFTKNVEFKDGTDNPKLLLSNGKYAEFDSGNATSDRHVFKYTVDSSDQSLIGSEILNVKKVITNGHKWYDGSNVFWNTTGDAEIDMTSFAYNLKANRSIYVDTKKPELTEIKAVSGSGYYKQGKVIYISGTFSEEVVSTFSGFKLKLNTGKETSSVKRTGPSSVLFTYTVGANENVNGLAVNEITYGNIKDRAGNAIDATKSPTYSGLNAINIDTKAPANLDIILDTTLSGEGTKKVVYDKQEVVATLQYDTTETTGVKKYTTNYQSDANATNTWSTVVTDSNGKYEKALGNGEYTINSYQEDAAGNKTENANPVSFKVDYGHILQSVKVDKPSGEYKYNASTPTVLIFTLHFRNNITSTDSKIKLNIGSGKEVSLKSGCSGTKDFVYEYTIAAGDNCEKLEISELIGTYKDEYGNNVNSFVALNNSGVSNFKDEKTIKIDNSTPSVTGVSLSGQVLTITFDQEITKSTDAAKKVVLEMTDTYKAPPYFTKENWSNYSGNSTIASCYESNTLGCSSTGVADLTEKFVLKFDKSIDDSTLTGALKTAGADKAELSINSSDVSISTTGNNAKKQLVLDFKTKIPVKGATYKVKIPTGLVKNSIGNENSANETYSVTLAGVEAPAVRVKKVNETVDTSTGETTQPVNAEARIDCQTPGAVITYKTATAVSTGITMENKASDDSENIKMVGADSNTVTSAPVHTFNYGDSNEYPRKTTDSNNKNPEDSGWIPTYTDIFNLTAGENNEKKGCQIRIQTIATKGTYTETSYEQATKTVIILKNRGAPSNYKYRCIRGGDWTNGGVSTPNFPFSWNTNEYDKIRMMTGDENKDNSEYYWVTWKLTTTAYVGFLAASNTIPSDINTKGPSEWIWASCGWVPDVSKFPIYPGETTTCDGTKGTKFGGFGFQDKHKQSR